MLVYIGIDWSTTHHDVCFMNEKGGIISQFEVPHSDEGIERIHVECSKLKTTDTQFIVGIETSHNLLLDYLVGYGYHSIYVIPPIMVKSSRGRFGAARSCTDRTDAHLIADLLRTDRARLCPWQPDLPLTQKIRARVSLINFMTHQITRTSNRLRAALLRYYPQAVNIFSSLKTNIAIEFVLRYPLPQNAQSLSFQEFLAFAKNNRYSHTSNLSACYARLQASFPGVCTEVTNIFQYETLLLANHLRYLVKAKNDLLKALVDDFNRHPDAAIFASLPGAGVFLAPALLSKFGDDRSRYPSRESIQAVAGTCPVTRASGKRKQVLFRKACDREFRTYAQQWAKESLKKSPWAYAYFDSIRPRCHSISHAYRCLANRWLAIVWRLWFDRIVYDENYHLHQRSLRVKSILV